MTEFATAIHHKYPGQLQPATEFGRTGVRGEDMQWPWFIDVSNTGDIAVADTDNSRVQVFGAHTNQCLFPPFGGQGTDKGKLQRPRSIKYSPILGTHFAVADTGNRRIVLLRINFKVGCLEYVSDFGQTMFREPTDIAFNWRARHIFVVDTSLNRVTIHEQDGSFVDQLRPDTPFSQPMGIAIDTNGKVYVTDTGNHCVKMFEANGDFVGQFGGFGSQVGQFNRPKGICIDRRGYIFIADECNNRVLMFSPDLRQTSEVASNVTLPKGVASHHKLIVSTGDPYSHIKIFNH